MQVGGEPTQIECYREDHVRSFMISNNVVLGKPPASTTELPKLVIMTSPMKALRNVLNSDVEADKINASRTSKESRNCTQKS